VFLTIHGYRHGAALQHNSGAIVETHLEQDAEPIAREKTSTANEVRFGSTAWRRGKGGDFHPRKSRGRGIEDPLRDQIYRPPYLIDRIRVDVMNSAASPNRQRAIRGGRPRTPLSDVLSEREMVGASLKRHRWRFGLAGKRPRTLEDMLGNAFVSPARG
jgi:hypothetical protein